MKKPRLILFFIISLLILSLPLSACEKPLKGDPFARFRDNFEARFGLECNGVNSELMCSRTGDSLTLTFEAPETLKGYTFTCTGDSSRLSYEDIEIDLTSDMARVPNIIKEIFSVTSEDITSISAESSDGGTLTCVEAKKINYIFTSDGAFKSAEGIVLGTEVKLTISEISYTAVSGDMSGGNDNNNNGDVDAGNQ